MKDFRNRDVDFREIIDEDKYTLEEKFDAVRREDCWFDAMVELEEMGEMIQRTKKAEVK